MQFQNNFDLEEFLAYLLPGFLFLGTLILQYKTGFGILYQSFAISISEFFLIFLAIVLFVTISVIFGHVFSLVSRYLWRNLTNAFLGDPEKAIFAAQNSFFTDAVNRLIASRFAIAFGIDMNTGTIRNAVPRLIRSYVFTRSQTAAVTRERIVRSRSVCANLTTPILIIATLGPMNMSIVLRGGLAIVAFLLLIKQRDLDVREAKEIYMTFVALGGASKPIPLAVNEAHV